MIFGRKKILFIAILLILAALVLEWGMGRSLFYEKGRIRLWSGDIWSDENSQQIADPYSFTHIIHGAAFYGLTKVFLGRFSMPVRFLTALAVESGWEVLENTDLVINRYREDTISLGYFGDSVLNSFFDILFAALGFWLAFKLPVKITVLGVIMVEIVLALIIRDNLIINIIMLVWPFEALKNWQLLL